MFIKLHTSIYSYDNTIRYFYCENKKLYRVCSRKLKDVLRDNIREYSSNDIPIINKNTIDLVLQIYKPLISNFLDFIIPIIFEENDIEYNEEETFKYKIYMILHESPFYRSFSTLEEYLVDVLSNKYRYIEKLKSKNEFSNDMIIYNDITNTMVYYFLTYLRAIDVFNKDTNNRVLILNVLPDNPLVKYLEHIDIDREDKSFLDIFTEFKYDYKDSSYNVYDGTDKYL